MTVTPSEATLAELSVGEVMREHVDRSVAGGGSGVGERIRVEEAAAGCGAGGVGMRHGRAARAEALRRDGGGTRRRIRDGRPDREAAGADAGCAVVEDR